MRISKWWGTIGLLLFACGGQPGVVVDIGNWPDGATSLQVTGTLDGIQSMETLSFPRGTTHFVVYVPIGSSGPLRMQLDALDEYECARASASTQVEIGSGLRALAEADITLTPLSSPACPAVELQDISPRVGPTAGGTLLTLTGHHFRPGITVSIATAQANSVLFRSPTQLTALLPAHAGAFGLVPVVLQNLDGQTAKRVDLFAYYTSQVAFSQKASFASDKLPHTVVTGDFNRDSILDLVTANGQSSVSVLLGDGKGSFGPAHDIGTYPNASSIALGDFNGDTNPDLAVVTYGSNSVNILLGDGKGGFNFTVDLPGIGIPGQILASDVNHDDVLDLVVTSGFTSTVDVLLGNAKGGFGPITPFPVGISPVAVKAGNLNGDPHTDLVVGNAGGSEVSVLLGDGQGHFSTAKNYTAGLLPSALVIADFNSDGKADLAVTNTGGDNISMLLGDGNGHFSAANYFSAGTAPYALTAADFDGDQQLDLAVAANGENAVRILLGDGHGAFGTTAVLPTSSGPRAVACGDFNGDGKPDIATANYSSDNVSVFLNQSQ